MASRERTALFIRYRDSFRGAERPHLNQDGIPENSKHGKRMAKQKLLERDGNGDVEMGVFNDAPPWIRRVESTMTLFEMIRSKKEELSKHMGKSKRIGFDEESENRRKREISALTEEISKLFKQCEHNIQGVLEGMDKHDPQDKMMRKNVQSSLATQLHALSVTFRKDQKRYLDKLKENEAKSRYRPEVNHDADLDDAGFNDGQMMELEETERSVSRRTEEIEKVAEGIRDLQTIFKELAVLIIDQGTIIDRIDYNVEKAAESTSKAAEELAKAERSQRRSPAMCCIMGLTIALGVMSLILILKILGYVNI